MSPLYLSFILPTLLAGVVAVLLAVCAADTVAAMAQLPLSLDADRPAVLVKRQDDGWDWYYSDDDWSWDSWDSWWDDGSSDDSIADDSWSAMNSDGDPPQGSGSGSGSGSTTGWGTPINGNTWVPPPVAAGQPCSIATAACDTGLQCYQNICTPTAKVPLALGDSCTDGQTPTCGTDLVCTAGKCATSTLILRGGKCPQTGLTCDNSTCIGGTCLGLIPALGACPQDSSTCGTGYICDQGACRLPGLALGTPCPQGTFACKSGAVCRNGKCCSSGGIAL